MSRARLALLLVAGCGGSGPLDVTRGDTTLHTRPDGTFDLIVDGRTLLSTGTPAVSVLDFNPSATSLWGQFDYQAGTLLTASTSRRASATVEGQDLLLSLEGDARATLRFTRQTDEVTIAVHAAAASLASPRGLTLRFACDDKARFLGFGEQYHRVEHRGEAFPLWVSEQGVGRDPARPSPFSGDPTTTYFPVPFFLDPRGFGLAVDTTARVAVDLCKTDPTAYTITVDEPADVLLHLYTGPKVADVLRAFTVRHGRSSAPPRWAIDGVWIGVQGGPALVTSAADRALAANVPVAAMWVQDWIGRLDLGGGLWDLHYHWTTDTTLYPDLAGLISSLHAKGVRFLGYFNPFILPRYDQWAEAVAKGYTVRRPDGKPYDVLISVFSGSMLDMTFPDAVAWFQGFARAALAAGMDGWMADFGEWLPYDAVIHSGEAPREHQLYPQRWHQANRDVLDADKVLLTRSGWLGEAKVAQVVWAGDQQADWEPWDGLPTVVPALISLGLAGISFSSHDVAGYTGGPSTKELYLRWLELAAFTPIFRTHEGLNTEKNWRWDSDGETLAAFSRWARVHRALADTYVALGTEHAATGLPIVRALALSFPDDPRAVSTSDEYTLGTDLLVAPVVAQGATTRLVYFPKGHWTSVWDPSVAIDGPVEKTIAAPLGQPPVFSLSARTDLKDIR